MEFATPVGLALAGLVLPLLALYFIRSRRPRVRVSSTFIWRRSLEESQAGRSFQRLVRHRSLFLELLALLALAVAAAGPSCGKNDAAAPAVALIVDVSASMATVSGETSRIERARAAAKRVVSSLPADTRVTVIEAGNEARQLTSLSTDRGDIERAIDSLSALPVEGDLTPAIGLGADVLRPVAGAQIVVVTDGNLAHPLIPEATAPIQFVQVGEDAENVAITRVESTRQEGDRIDSFVALSNFGGSQREIFLTVRREGATDTLDSRRLLLEPHQKTAAVFSTPADDGADPGLIFEISPHDALAVDDIAYSVAPKSDDLEAIFFAASGASSTWVERALSSDPHVSLVRTDAADARLLEEHRDDPLVILEGACPEALPGRVVLIVDPPAGACAGVGVAAKQKGLEITSWDDADSRMRFVSLPGVHLDEGSILTPPGAGPNGDAANGRLELARSSRGPVIVDASDLGRSITLVGFDVGKSDWPLRSSFVVFIRNLVEEARSRRSGGGPSASPTGAAIRVALPRQATSARVRRPSGDELILSAVDGVAVLPPQATPGFYRVTTDSPDRRFDSLLALDLESSAESDLGRMAALPMFVKEETAGKTIHWWTGSSGWVFALLALALLAIDLSLLAVPGQWSLRSFAAPFKRPVLVFALVAAAGSLCYLAWSRRGGDGPLRFTSAGVLGLVVAILVFANWRLASVAAPSKGALRRVLIEGFASVSLLALALSGVGVSIRHVVDRVLLLLVVDRSRSVDTVPDLEGRIGVERARAISSMSSDDRVGTVVFGGDAASEEPLHLAKDEVRFNQVEVSRDASDIDKALRRAIALVPEGYSARIELLSDGIETRGDSISAASLARARAIPVDTFALDRPIASDARVVAVTAPDQGNTGEWIDLRVVTHSDVATVAEMQVIVDDQPPARTHVRLRAGEDVFRLHQKLGFSGMHRYRVVLGGIDPRLDVSPFDNDGSAFVRVRGPSSALVLEGDPGQAGFVGGALEQAGMRVEVGNLATMPADVGGFARYDLVVLSDIAAHQLSPSEIAALAAYVRDFGGGLLLLGGDRSLGPGGYSKTPIEEVSPVSFDLRDDVRRGTLAEVIGIDISGSMGMDVNGQTKLALANEAATRSASMLGPADLLGVEHVDTEVHWSVPLEPAVDQTSIEKRIRSVGVGGGGIIVPITMTAGYAALSDASTSIRHMLLFADGDDAEEIESALDLTSQARTRQITTSAVALGRGKDVRALEEMAKRGGGRFYLIEDATRLPTVFAEETVLASRAALIEEPFRARAAEPSPVLAGVDLAAAPELGGYVVTLPKPRASVALRGPEGDPILATWTAGLGRSAAFTSDLKGRWGAKWTAWSGAARLVAQLGRSLSKGGGEGGVRLSARAEGGVLRLRAEVHRQDLVLDSLHQLTAVVTGPQGFRQEVEIPATSARTYQVSLPLSLRGTYLVALTDESHQLLGSAGAELSLGDELRPTPTNRTLLSQLAELSGGKVRTSLADVLIDRPPPTVSFEDISRRLAGLGAVALLFFVAARKLTLPQTRIRALFTRSRRRLPPASPHPAKAGAPASVPVEIRDAPIDAPLSLEDPPPVEGIPAAPIVDRRTSAERLADKRLGRKIRKQDRG